MSKQLKKQQAVELFGSYSMYYRFRHVNPKLSVKDLKEYLISEGMIEETESGVKAVYKNGPTEARMAASPMDRAKASRVRKNAKEGVYSPEECEAVLNAKTIQEIIAMPLWNLTTSRGNLNAEDVPLVGEITAEWLREKFYYIPETGEFGYRRHRKPCMVGAPITAKQTAGYYYVLLNGKNYLVHRLAWFYMTGAWPTDMVDHINGVRDDNRWDNLRSATRSQNLTNVGIGKGNTSGHKNIGKRYRTLKDGSKSEYYIVSMQIRGVKHTKFAKTLEKAIAWRDATLKKYAGEFAHESLFNSN